MCQRRIKKCTLNCFGNSNDFLFKDETRLYRPRMEFEEEIVAGEGEKKIFKKMLLNKCQDEFDTDVSDRIEEAIEGVEDDEERHLKKYLAKKQYLGHLIFMGELYIRKLISIKIIFMILTQLLEGNDENGTEDEEKVECFSTLMNIVGLILEQRCVDLWSNGKRDAIDMLEACWDKAAAVNNRIKSMLQDLLELRNNGEYVLVLDWNTILYCALNVMSFFFLREIGRNTWYSV